MAKLITPDTEHIDPHAEPPWRRSEHDPDAQERIQLYIPENKPGTSVKLEWAEDHASLYDEYKRDNDFMFVYTDGSLSYYNGVRRTGYGVAIYRNDTEIASEKGPMGEHVEAYDTEMKALEVASRLIHEIVNSMETPPLKIILATDNMGALQRIFQGSPGKAQKCSDTFRKHIIDILDQHTNVQFAFTWCPGHFDIEGNERADRLAKSGSRLTHEIPAYKSLSYVGSLQKREIGEEWRHRWSNHDSTLRSNFHVANRIPPSTKPTARLTRLDRRTFSRTLQCRTGHAHIREYYRRFVPSEEQSCHCSDTLQSRHHILYECKTHRRHRHLLGTGRARNIETLLGSEKGIRRLARFLKASRAYDKRNAGPSNDPRHNGRRKGGPRESAKG